VLRTWRDLSARAPRQATFTASLAGDQNVVTVGFVWVGPPAAGRQVPSMKPLGKPLTERMVELSYVDLQRIDDTPQGQTLRRYQKGHYIRELSDDAIEALLQSRAGPTTESRSRGGRRRPSIRSPEASTSIRSATKAPKGCVAPIRRISLSG
jgi:hypothetical protein